jgi:hypothetical protein
MWPIAHDLLIQPVAEEGIRRAALFEHRQVLRNKKSWFAI